MNGHNLLFVICCPGQRSVGKAGCERVEQESWLDLRNRTVCVAGCCFGIWVIAENTWKHWVEASREWGGSGGTTFA